MGQRIEAHMTWEDYRELPENGTRYEVLEGTLMMSPAPGYRHQCASLNLSYLLEQWRRSGGDGGRVLTAPFDVVLAHDTIVQPDLVYVSAGNLGRIIDERLQGAPDLVVEIFHAAGARRDRVAKLQIYAAFRIPEYWLVDLDARTVELLLLSRPGYQVIGIASGSVAVASSALPGLTVRPADVFLGL